MKHKLREWLKRYGIPELNGFILTLILGNVAYFLTKNIVISAFVGTWADNLGFYGTIIYRDVKHRKKKYGKIRFKDFWILFRNTLIEFGPAEYLDSFLLRPFYLAVFPLLISNYTLAITLATIAANVTYYIPVIISYEFRKKTFKE